MGESPRFLPGEIVVVRAIQRRGRVHECLKNGRYLVRVGDLEIRCKVDELDAVLDQPAKPKKSKPIPVVVQLPAHNSQQDTLDLHGMRVAEAIQAVELAINRAILHGHATLRVIHGIGSGKIMDALDRHLPSLGVVKSFKRDPGNPGVTLLYF